MRFFLLIACGKGAVGGLDLFSHFTLGKVQVRWLFVSCRGSRSPNSPFALSRLANFTHAVAARLRLSVPTWQHVHRRVRLTLPENANSCSCASFTCALASESHRIACGTRTRQLCAWFQTSRVSPCLRLARLRHGHTCCKHERRHVDTDCL